MGISYRSHEQNCNIENVFTRSLSAPCIQTCNRHLVRDEQCNIHSTSQIQNTEALRKSEHWGSFSRNANLSGTTTASIWHNSSACNPSNIPGNFPWTCHS